MNSLVMDVCRTAVQVTLLSEQLREREELHHSQRQPVRTIVPFFVIVRAGGHVERVRRGEGLRGDGLAADED